MTHRRRPTHEDPAFLRRADHETLAHAGVALPTLRATDVSSLDSAAPVSVGAAAFSGGVIVAADRRGIVVSTPGLPPLFYGDCKHLQFGGIDATVHIVSDAQMQRERGYLRAQLLGEARDCRAAFFRDASGAAGSTGPIDWRLLDAAEAFERRAEAVR